MKLGCNTVDFRKYDVDTAMERIASAGYKWVEVEGNLAWCEHVDTWKDDPLKFRDKVKSHGFAGCSCIGSHRELITEDTAVDDIKRSLEFAAEAGVPVVATGEGRMPEGMKIEEALEILKPKFEELARAAERVRVHLCIEPHGSLSLSPGGLERIISLAPSEWIGVNFDTANPHRGDYVGTTRDGYGWKLDQAAAGDEVAVLRPVINKVHHVHLKDVIGREAVVIGEGEVRIKEILTMLRDAGYEGVLSYETEGSQDADDAQVMIERSLVFAKNMLDELGIMVE
jgi:L-ribulose-5-phosphate 3-epimerase